MDEGYTINAVLSILETGSSILPSGEFYSCPLYCYPTAWITTLFGDNAFSYRLLSVLFSVLLLPLFYFCTKNLFERRTALVSTFFLAFSYFQIAWARQARWYTMFEFFFFLSCFCFYKFLNERDTKKKILYLLLTTFTTTLTCLTQALGFLLIFIFAFLYALQIYQNKNQNFNKYLFPILTLLFLVGVYFSQSLLARINFSYVLPYYLNFYLYNYLLFIPFAIFVAYSKSSIYKKQIFYFTFISLTYLLSLSFLTNTVHYRYLFHITPLIILLGTLGILEVYEKLKSKNQKYFFIIFILAFYFISDTGTLWPKDFYFLEQDENNFATYLTPVKPYFASTPQPDWNSAYQYIQDNMLTDEVIISSMPQFNRIFLGTPGYWIQYSYADQGENMDRNNDNKEFYVGAHILHNLSELQALTSSTTGYIVLDQMAKEKISPDIIEYIEHNTTQVFAKETNTYSKLWVYKFDKI
jgi:4-amino-4-deoxy-L-arabinose transferase-like glycosyltransferase